MKSYRYLPVLVFITLSASALFAQQGFTNETRALFILDISRYVQFDDSTQEREEFSITLLDNDANLFFDLEKLAKTRKEIQGKPIRISVCTAIEKLDPVQVVFLNRVDEFRIEDVISKISGFNTLLISEGYPFR